MRTPFAKPLVGANELEVIARVLASGQLTEGPVVAEFEEAFRDFVGGGKAIAVSSCTAALHLSLVGLSIQSGDKVYCPALTHAATAQAIIAAGAEPVFVDCLEDGNIDPDLIGSDAQAICVVHFLGRPAKMALIKDHADTHGMVVVEDCALALGAGIDGRHCGLFSDAGCFSFYPSKMITTAEGGMVVTTNNALAKKITRMRAFGKETWPTFDIVSWGLNYRMSEVHAAIGLGQMTRLHEIIVARIRHMTRLHDELQPRIIGGNYAVSYIATSDQAAVAVRTGLRRRNLETSVYYPMPVPLLQWFRKQFDHEPGDFPMAEKICRRSITLPIGPHVTDQAITNMIECIREIDP